MSMCVDVMSQNCGLFVSLVFMCHQNQRLSGRKVNFRFRVQLGRHVRGSRNWIPRSDPKDLHPGSVRIIDPTLTVCRQIHWDHSSAFTIRQEIHSDQRSKTPYCVGIHRDPISDKWNSCIFYPIFKKLTAFSLKYQSNLHCYMIL